VTEVVVLSGSLGTTAAMWEPQLPALERRFRVVRVDHPGHGGVPPAPVRDVSDLARRTLEQVDAERFSFVGLSLGGAVGVRIALDVPERVNRLVVACAAARFGPGYRERAQIVRAEGLEAIVETVLERWFTPSFSDVQRYRAMFLSNDPEGYARCCEAVAAWDVRGELAALRVPTLCIAAADDPVTPPASLTDLAAEIPDARAVVLPGARHLANVERADEFNAALLGHL
jgi:3-oxoadipate enol-lactonase